MVGPENGAAVLTHTLLQHLVIRTIRVRLSFVRPTACRSPAVLSLLLVSDAPWSYDTRRVRSSFVPVRAPRPLFLPSVIHTINIDRTPSLLKPYLVGTCYQLPSRFGPFRPSVLPSFLPSTPRTDHLQIDDLRIDNLQIVHLQIDHLQLEHLDYLKPKLPF